MTSTQIQQEAIEQVKQGIDTLTRRLSKRENAEWSERLAQYKVGLDWLENNNNADFWQEMKSQDFQSVAIAIATKDFSEIPSAVAKRLFGDLV